MARFADGPIVQVSVSIDAAPEVVWELVSDINLPARFQGEFVEANWLDEGPALDARFVGKNQRGDREWETTSWLVVYEPMTAFGWAVSDKDNPGASWTYSLKQTESGTMLRYRRRIGPGPSGLTAAIARYPDREEEIIAARDEEHRVHMQAVIEGIRDLAEST